MNHKIQLTLLGTGTSQGIPVIGCNCKVCTSPSPHDKRLRTAALIQVDNIGISIDIGPDFRQQMLNAGFTNVHAVLLTHEHNDHISGLDDIRPINFLYQRNIPIYGGKRTLSEMVRRFFYAFDMDYHYPGKPRVTAVEIDETPFQVENISIIPVLVDHGDMMVYGYRIGKVAYITDAKTISDKSKDLLKDLDILVLNALRFEKHSTHLNIDEAIDLFMQLKPKQCYLTHISHEMGLHDEVSKRLPEGMHLGYDGLTISL